MRHGQKFGESSQDKELIANLRRGKLVQPFKARLEGKGYGVYVGGRRFQAKKYFGTKQFVVGEDCLIDNATEDEARLASWTENLQSLRSTMDPITRARALNEILSNSPTSLRSDATRMGMQVSTLSQWLKVLELNPKMQEVTSQNKIFFTDALQVAKLQLGDDLQDNLAKLAKDDYEAFKRELKRLLAGKGKRGIPKDVYWIIRLTLDKRNRKHQKHYKMLDQVAEAQGKSVQELIQEYVITHIDEIVKAFA